MPDDSTAASSGPRSGGAGRAVLVVPVNDVERLAAVCALAGVRASVVLVRGVGCVVVPDRPADAEAGAARLSRLVRGADVLLVSRTGGRDAGAAWRGGVRGAVDADAALLLASWPATVEGLLAGELDPAEAGGVRSAAGPRARLAWRLLRGPRRWG
ncbi:hypothetical protein MO973_41660 [Paenibacillus sp. TRM 82003]|uniref:hypothetical protein n=1 Tax=Kineococcus sp. TRM81007 TaxID=2925831 RepID=UPI001F5AC61A|nr:hypothetical protein [Kineococcus sp. TRM81007]MCI2239736.1 hypothetical protein [Kineococcus sp. TRM81007]MCI3926701.1 hypothetical protein [Paenibacillus sp. TRM 82003]